ncbi:J domain-containing protein [Phycicoccus flavus]|uniref:J domain-containing protein n=1 Tax=Phycicoccus flavus TaxID=2502783 RepID=UPI000FEBDD8F|nr:DnaJ domain-containing protein [Phycicoccus flavus]NHA68713.1 J domain-containing protein [Phycicoccus flavus]
MATESYEPSYYDVLGVPEDAASPEIGRAFMRAMRRAHPDAHAGDDEVGRAGAEEHARLLTEAHGVLTGRDRGGYDARLAAWREGAASEHEPLLPGETTGDEEEPILPEGAPSEVVLPLARQRWLRGGRLTPVVGGAPIDVPAQAGHHETLVYPGRGAPGPDGSPADLAVRVVHVDRHGAELPDGHDAPTRRGDVLRRMRPGDAALLALGLLVVLAAAVVLLATR